MFQKYQPVNTPAINPNVEHQRNDDVETVVGPSVKVEGDFASEGNIIVKGIVSGSVRTSRTLTVENGAKIFANVNAENAVVSGGIKGNVKVSERLDLTETAQINGDIECKVLSIAPGALVLGKVVMKGLGMVEEGEGSGRKKFFSKTKGQVEEENDNLTEA